MSSLYFKVLQCSTVSDKKESEILSRGVSCRFKSAEKNQFTTVSTFPYYCHPDSLLTI